MRKQHMEEERDAMQGSYTEILRKLNALIVGGRWLALYHVDMFLKHNKSLTPIQKQYLISKARAAYHEYVEFLRDGLKFVWQLPIDMRDINAYRHTLTHIRYLPVGQKQFRLLQKSIKMMRQEKTVEFLQKSLATEFLTGDMHQLFLKYCVKTKLAVLRPRRCVSRLLVLGCSTLSTYMKKLASEKIRRDKLGRRKSDG